MGKGSSGAGGKGGGSWLKDKSLVDLDNLPDPKELAEDIVENIEAGLNNFRTVLAALGK